MDPDFTHVADKSDWPRGPWDDEPDYAQWRDEATGLPCVARRNERYGHWCGYVGVPPGHPAHGRDYEEEHETLPELDVHGGLTYAAPCDPEHGICHVPGPGEGDDFWWLGFDCGHFMDHQPGLVAMERELGMPGGLPPPGISGTYRSLGYVKDECARLAQSLRGGSAS
jgi:hypothetical protein